MKVVFELTAEQVLRANEIRQRLADEVVASPSGSCEESMQFGNLLLPSTGSPGFNSGQKLDLQGKRIVYEGQRCSLAQDGGIEVLWTIAGYLSFTEAVLDNWSRLKMVLYQTSDHRFFWYETLGSYICKRATIKEVAEYMRSEPEDQMAVWIALSLRHTKYIKIIRGLSTNDQSVYAEFGSEEIAIGRKFVSDESFMKFFNCLEGQSL